MPSETEIYLLDIGSEDYCRMWEAVIAHRKTDPQLSEQEAMRTAQDTIRRFLQAGFIELYLDDLVATTVDKRVARKLEVWEHQAVFDSEASWRVPSRPRPDCDYAYATTASGEQACWANS